MDKPSLSDIWVVYENMFDTLNDAKEALNILEVFSEWLKEAQHYNQTYVDKTLKVL